MLSAVAGFRTRVNAILGHRFLGLNILIHIFDLICNNLLLFEMKGILWISQPQNFFSRSRKLKPMNLVIIIFLWAIIRNSYWDSHWNISEFLEKGHWFKWHGSWKAWDNYSEWLSWNNNYSVNGKK